MQTIEEQGKLTQELKKQIEEAMTQVAVEDLYRPFLLPLSLLLKKQLLFLLKDTFVLPFLDLPYPEAVIHMIDEGDTIPFIARYRKEKHGAMNDEALRNLSEFILLPLDKPFPIVFGYPSLFS